MVYGGAVNDQVVGQSSDDCQYVLDGLKAACNDKRKNFMKDCANTIKFPTVSEQPQSEFNGLPIFSNAYPWLFPGGVGDLDNHNMQERGYVSKWLKTLILYYELGLTAMHPASDRYGELIPDCVLEPEGTLSRSVTYLPSYCPCYKRLSEVTNHSSDIIGLVNAVQTHRCGNYCMRSKSATTQRYCRAGCGLETTKGGCDTPGFSIRYEPAIAREANGTFKLSLKRNSTRMVQSSIKLLRLWRANCDVQLLIYKSDPHNPDVYEVSKVTDYVVSYACKGNSTTATVIQVMNSLVQR